MSLLPQPLRMLQTATGHHALSYSRANTQRGESAAKPPCRWLARSVSANKRSSMSLKAAYGTESRALNQFRFGHVRFASG